MTEENTETLTIIILNCENGAEKTITCKEEELIKKIIEIME